MQQDSFWKNELAAIAAIIEKAPLQKVTKWGADVYTHAGQNIVSYGGFKQHFALWFFNGVFLADPYKVLINGGEGKTKSLRQWRFTDKSQIDERKILEYIHEAIEVERQGLKIKPTKFVPAPIPALLQGALDESPTLTKAFTALTPGRQKEYILYLNEPKLDATKINRLEKIKPMILAGVGLNDRYK